METEGDSKVIIDCYNIRNSLPGSIIILMEYIWRLSQDLNIYNYRHIHREVNKTLDCLVKKCLYNTNNNIW